MTCSIPAAGRASMGRSGLRTWPSASCRWMKGNTWLVGQYRFVLDAYSWEIPEGAATRLCRRSNRPGGNCWKRPGLVAAEWLPLMEMHLSNSVSDERAYMFLARGLEQREAEPEETEQLVVRKLPFEEAYRMVERGEITDSMSVASILKVKLMLVQGQLSFA
jgi:hypothetical protein